MTRISYGRGVTRGALVAGPAFLAALALFGLAGTIAPVPGRVAATMLGGILFMLFAVPVGALIAIVPVLIGTVALAHLSRGNDAMRLPVTWGLAGGLSVAAALPAAAADTIAMAGPALVATGVLCALAARSGVRWQQVEGDNPWRRHDIIR